MSRNNRQMQDKCSIKVRPTKTACRDTGPWPWPYRERLSLWNGRNEGPGATAVGTGTRACQTRLGGELDDPFDRRGRNGSAGCALPWTARSSTQAEVRHHPSHAHCRQNSALLDLHIRYRNEPSQTQLAISPSTPDSHCLQLWPPAIMGRAAMACCVLHSYGWSAARPTAVIFAQS